MHKRSKIRDNLRIFFRTDSFFCKKTCRNLCAQISNNCVKIFSTPLSEIDTEQIIFDLITGKKLDISGEDGEKSD
jgi:hypothetical protein